MDPYFTSSYKPSPRVSPYQLAYEAFRKLPVAEQMEKMHAWATQEQRLTPEEHYIRGKIGAAYRMLGHISKGRLAA